MLFHVSNKAIQRSKGQSLVASFAYTSGYNIFCAKEQKTKYSNRKEPEDVLFNILTDVSGSREATQKDIAEYANTIEKLEKRKDATLAKEMEIALPAEFNLKQNIQLSNAIQKRFVEMTSTLALGSIHNSSTKTYGKGSRKKGNVTLNKHFHLKYSERIFDPETKTFGKKNQMLNIAMGGREFTKVFRYEVERITKAHAKHHGIKLGSGIDGFTCLAHKDRYSEEKVTKGYTAIQKAYDKLAKNAKGYVVNPKAFQKKVTYSKDILLPEGYEPTRKEGVQETSTNKSKNVEIKKYNSSLIEFNNRENTLLLEREKVAEKKKKQQLEEAAKAERRRKNSLKHEARIKLYEKHISSTFLDNIKEKVQKPDPTETYEDKAIALAASYKKYDDDCKEIQKSAGYGVNIIPHLQEAAKPTIEVWDKNKEYLEEHCPHPKKASIFTFIKVRYDTLRSGDTYITEKAKDKLYSAFRALMPSSGGGSSKNIDKGKDKGDPNI